MPGHCDKKAFFGARKKFPKKMWPLSSRGRGRATKNTFFAASLTNHEGFTDNLQNGF